MRPIGKVGIVAGLYVAAFAFAWIVVDLYIAATNTPDRQTYAAMYDFGDMLYFLAVFFGASLPAAGAALFFLRPYPVFWFTLSIASLVVSLFSMGAFVTYLAPCFVGPLSMFGSFAPLLAMASPLFGVFFLLSGVIAPVRPARNSLIFSTVIEFSACAYMAFILVSSARGL
jgi:hypothetical protein